MIKPAAGPLSHQLTKVFNQCVDNNEFPSDAKLADVVPVHKKNDNINIMNYRPVSILSSMSKVLEKLILRQMTPFLRKLLDPRIAAYRQGHSCQDVLLRLHTCQPDRSQMTEIFPIDNARALTWNGRRACTAKV